MGRWILRIGGGLVVAVALVALLAWLTLRASLPTLDGEISVVGLDAMATIERDADGIPTITASSRADLAYATGFAHGQDRFFQMDLLRRRSAGELAEMFGEIAAEADKRYRWHRFRSRAVEGFGKMSQRDKQLLERYAG
jgi:penicillin amidase